MRYNSSHWDGRLVAFGANGVCGAAAHLAGPGTVYLDTLATTNYTQENVTVVEGDQARSLIVDNGGAGGAHCEDLVPALDGVAVCASHAAGGRAHVLANETLALEHLVVRGAHLVVVGGAAVEARHLEGDLRGKLHVAAGAELAVGSALLPFPASLRLYVGSAAALPEHVHFGGLQYPTLDIEGELSGMAHLQVAAGATVKFGSTFSSAAGPNAIGLASVVVMDQGTIDTEDLVMGTASLELTVADHVHVKGGGRIQGNWLELNTARLHVEVGGEISASGRGPSYDELRSAAAAAARASAAFGAVAGAGSAGTYSSKGGTSGSVMVMVAAAACAT
jgi:hypothetical protein